MSDAAPPPVAPEGPDSPWTPGAPGLPPASPVSRRRGPLVPILLAVFLLGGTGAAVVLTRSDEKKPSATSSPEALPEGWALREVRSDGFALGLPPGWRDVPTDSADEAFQALQGENPELAAMVRDQFGGSVSTFIRFMAFDLQSPTLAEEFATNLNIIVSPVPAGTGFDSYVEANVSQLRGIPGLASDISQDEIALPAGRAAVVRSRLTLNVASGSGVAAVTQYLLLVGTRGFILSFSTTPTHAASYAPAFERIARTFRTL